MLRDPQTYCATSGNSGNRKQRNFLNHALTFQRLHEEWTFTKKMSTLLILEIGRLLSLFPYESLEMSGDEMSRIGSIVRSHYMGSCYCLLWKLNDCVANYTRGFSVIFFLYHVTLFFCSCLSRLPTMNKVLYYKVMHKNLFLREKRATEALGN